jgi:hypothetical protein
MHMALSTCGDIAPMGRTVTQLRDLGAVAVCVPPDLAELPGGISVYRVPSGAWR